VDEKNPPLDRDVLREALTGKPLGSMLVHLEETASTSDVAWAKARAGAPEGLVVAAERQDAGRGRTGNVWHSAEGLGLWFSVLLRPPADPEKMGRLTCAAGVAVADALRETAGLEPGLKWPNDVLVADRKIAGILTETKSHFPDPRPVILGIGINVLHREDDFPPELAGVATSVRMEEGAADRTGLLIGVLDRLAAWYRRLLADDREAVEEAFQKLCMMRDRTVVLTVGRETVRGAVLRVTCADGMTLALDDGTERTFRSEHIANVELLPREGARGDGPP